MYICMYMCIYVYMYICIYTYMYICIYVYMHVYMCICIHVYMYICMYDICIHPPHTYKKSPRRRQRLGVSCLHTDLFFFSNAASHINKKCIFEARVCRLFLILDLVAAMTPQLSRFRCGLNFGCQVAPSLHRYSYRITISSHCLDCES